MCVYVVESFDEKRVMVLFDKLKFDHVSAPTVDRMYEKKKRILKTMIPLWRLQYSCARGD